MSTLLVCDVCSDRSREAKRAELRTGRMVADPAGGPSTPEIRVVDLCLPCAIRHLQDCVQIPAP